MTPGRVISTRSERNRRRSTLVRVWKIWPMRPMKVRSLASTSFSPQPGQCSVVTLIPQVAHRHCGVASLVDSDADIRQQYSQMTTRSDKDLGLDRPIARRDFLQGAAIGVGGVLLGGLAPELVAAAADIAEQDRTGYY